MQAFSTHLLIRSTRLTRDEPGDEYEFILNDHLNVVECAKLDIGLRSSFHPVQNHQAILAGMLFELIHVRVNPLLDNTWVIAKLTRALLDIGVQVSHQPQKNEMAICYKPMGEIRDNVRFYLNKEGKLVFLSPIARPRLVYSKPKA